MDGNKEEGEVRANTESGAVHLEVGKGERDISKGARYKEIPETQMKTVF